MIAVYFLLNIPPTGLSGDYPRREYGGILLTKITTARGANGSMLGRVVFMLTHFLLVHWGPHDYHLETY